MASHFHKSRSALLIALAFVMASASFAPFVATTANAAESSPQRAVTAIQSDSAAPQRSVLIAESRPAETLLTQLQQKQWWPAAEPTLVDWLVVSFILHAPPKSQTPLGLLTLQAEHIRIQV